MIMPYIKKNPTIAVLALQGAFIEHEQRLRALGCDVFELRQLNDLNRAFDGLVLPGGESTTQAKLLHDLNMLEPLKKLIVEGMPVLGTCAGLILLAKDVENASDGRQPAEPDSHNAQLMDFPECFGTMPITVKRNGYGRQLGSFHANAPLSIGGKDLGSIPMTFIRAPRIVSVREDVEILAKIDEDPVAVRFENQIGIAFHPELDEDNKLYQLFLDRINY